MKTLAILKVFTPAGFSTKDAARIARGQAATVRGTKLTCTAGKLWVTLNGDRTDYILDAGSSIGLAGAAVVSGLADSGYQVA